MLGREEAGSGMVPADLFQHGWHLKRQGENVAGVTITRVRMVHTASLQFRVRNSLHSVAMITASAPCSAAWAEAAST